jgi:hypothetical protein
MSPFFLGCDPENLMRQEGRASTPLPYRLNFIGNLNKFDGRTDLRPYLNFKEYEDSM